MNGYSPNTPSSPDDNRPTSGEGGTTNTHLQWLIQSVTELKTASSTLNSRVDDVYSHLSDAKNDASLACAISKMEGTLSGIEKQLAKLDTINTTLADHAVKLTGLADMDGKLDKLDDIEKTMSRTKVTIATGIAVITACAGVTWFIFGSYLGKIIEALNALVLKQ
ncbi:hypothetical protein PVM12_14690 [Enterobacter soli]|uniref:hypothetical protein n=1 Tax=Enterobacter soli TaxID=885040 RepID=UPI002379190E|nr:hypothetical protein [Enterobacter soli]MDD9245281.1 hypothetical protein [Enterobacter soli]